MRQSRRRWLAIHAALFVAYGSLFALIAAVTGLVWMLNARPDLHPWHVAELDEEFTRRSAVADFTQYLALEDRLFAQLDESVYAQTDPADADSIIRYRRGSLADPQRWPRNWNRSYELPAQRPAATVLLLHGLSDSPYSLRHLGRRLNAANAHVLALRIPGHGTAPAGLVEVRWQDMAAAVKLAVQHLSARHPGVPLSIVGYSNGAALAVQYALETLGDATLDPVHRLVLISPEIGVTPVAALAVWQGRLGHFLGLEKLAWESINAEYDPFKYGSFAINAGDVSHRLTRRIQRLLKDNASAGRLAAMPPILAFSSVVDATVLVPALAEHLLNRLPADVHELVLFDINARVEHEHLLRWNKDDLQAAVGPPGSPGFAVSLITNRFDVNGPVIERHWPAGQIAAADTVLRQTWPDDVYSLSHVALPFPPEDPLYGGDKAAPGPGLQLGNLALRGERGVLTVSPAAMLRMRWNPFYPYLESRTLGFLGLGPTAHRHGAGD
jgi:alpha-beta hydrolase superfamily lysophospholipase